MKVTLYVYRFVVDAINKIQEADSVIVEKKSSGEEIIKTLFGGRVVHNNNIRGNVGDRVAVLDVFSDRIDKEIRKKGIKNLDIFIPYETYKGIQNDNKYHVLGRKYLNRGRIDFEVVEL